MVTRASFLAPEFGNCASIPIKPPKSWDASDYRVFQPLVSYMIVLTLKDSVDPFGNLMKPVDPALEQYF